MKLQEIAQYSRRIRLSRRQAILFTLMYWARCSASGHHIQQRRGGAEFVGVLRVRWISMSIGFIRPPAVTLRRGASR